MYKILVVDDSALMRRVICDIINADSDFRVIDVSADGEDAYKKIKNNPYDLVVLDMILPKLTGVELLERLYNEKTDANTVLISSSLKEDADSTMKAMEYGAARQGVEVFNMGTGNPYSVLEAIDAFERNSGVKIPYEIGPRREGDLPEFWADVSKAKRVLGWRAKRGLDEMCRDSWNWERKYSNFQKNGA